MAIYDVLGNAVNADLPITTDWYIGSDLIRKALMLTELGSLKYQQAFCIYNGKYYSTDGSHIAEQDSSFSVLRDVSINVGHGNSLQLGSNGKAYVSGWDDNKVYVVDLATLTITNTITLPTTGYTTCAIDDINEIAYIWQRSTYPSTEDIYNFIVYDYGNTQTIITTEITKPFSAMQAVDMCMDLIIVLNGLGTDTAPNGYRIYDKTGKVISEYIIGSKSSIEPEGVFVDRNTQEVYISFVDKKVYKIT